MQGLRFDSERDLQAFLSRNKPKTMTPKTPEIPSEHEEQKNLIYWCEVMSSKYPDLKWIYAIPNGGDRYEAVAAKLKAEGVKPGVPDLCLPVPKKTYHGLYIEMKRLKGVKVSGNQKKWLSALKERGYSVCVCNGFEAAKEKILSYLEK